MILIAIGVVIVLAIIIDGLWRKRRSEAIQRNINQRQQNQQQIEDTIVEPEPEPEPEPELEPEPEPEPKYTVETPTAEVTKPEVQENPIDDFIILTVMAAPGENFGGFNLLQTLLKAGLKHGAMDIFHRHEKLDDATSSILFSVAAVTKPGTFDIRNMHKTQTKGLSLFMSVTDGQDTENTFEIMLACAEQLAEKLSGQICDRQRQALSPRALQACRQRCKFASNIAQQIQEVKEYYDPKPETSD